MSNPEYPQSPRCMSAPGRFLDSLVCCRQSRDPVSFPFSHQCLLSLWCTCLLTCKNKFNTHTDWLFTLTYAQRSQLCLHTCSVVDWALLALLKATLVNLDLECCCFQTQPWVGCEMGENWINHGSRADEWLFHCLGLSQGLCENLLVPNSATAAVRPFASKYFILLLWKITFAFRAEVYWINQRYPKEITERCFLGLLVVLWRTIPRPLTDDLRAIFGFQCSKIKETPINCCL